MFTIEIAATGPIHYITFDGTYEASFALLAQIWDGLAENLGSHPVAAFVSRDKVFFTGAANEDGLKMLDLLTADVSDVDYRISQNLYRWEDGDWHLHRAFDPEYEATLLKPN